MMALLSPHVARPRCARRSAETKLEEAVRSEGEHLGLLGARDKEVSIETISLAVSGVTETEENISNENSQVVNSRLELRQKVRNSLGNFALLLIMTCRPASLFLTQILESLDICV